MPKQRAKSRSKGPSRESFGPRGPWVWSAYRAYNDLLREKIRMRFEAKEGPWMDRVADLLADLVRARWEGRTTGADSVAALSAKLDRLLAE